MAGRQITTDNGLAAAAAVNSIVQITVEMCSKVKMTADGSSMDFGESKIGSSYISAGKVIRAIYDNKTAVAKEFHFTMEMLY